MIVQGYNLGIKKQTIVIVFFAEIIGGMLDLEPRLWRHPRKESFESQRKKVIEFGAKWKDFDLTKKQNRESDSGSSSSNEKD